MNERCETVKVKDGESYRIINKADFEAEGNNYEIYAEKGFGQPDDAVVGATDGRNTSGTFSEPTPTDIRYPDQRQTEFENNQGAFIAKSAAEMRTVVGLPDAPGGLTPDPTFVPGTPGVTKAVKDGETVDAAAIVKGEADTSAAAKKAADKQAAYDKAKTAEAEKAAADQAAADKAAADKK